MKTIYTKSTKTTNYFVRFLAIIVLFVCSICLLTAFFYTLSVRTSEKSHYKQIEDTRLYIDNRITEDVQDYLHNNINRTISSVNTFFSFLKSTDSDADYFQKIRIDLFDHYLLKQDILKDILLFRAHDDSFVSATRAGYTLDSTYDYATVNYTDLHELVALEPLTSPSFYITSNSRLYYIFPVYLSVNDISSKYLGFAGLYINSDNFFNLSHTELGVDFGTTLILKDNEIIYVEGENVLSEKAVTNVISHFSDARESGTPLYSYNTNFASTEYSFYCTESNTYGLTFLYYKSIIKPADLFFNFQTDLSKLYWFSVILITVLFTILLIHKLHIFRKSRLYAKNSPNSEDISQARENYIFKNTIDLLYGNISPLSLENTLCHILNTGKTDKYTACIIIDPEPLTVLKMTPEQRSVFLVEIVDSVRMNLETSLDTHFAIIGYPQHKLTCLINSNNFLPENLAHNIHQHLEGVYNCHFNVFCTAPTLLPSDLPRNYETIINGLKYSYIYNYNNLFTQDSIERYEATDEIIDSNLGPKMRQYFRDHDFDGLAHYLSAIPDDIRRNGYSHSRVSDHYRTIFFNVTSYCTANYADFPYRSIPSPDLMKQFETIDEATIFLAEAIRSLNNVSIPTEKEQGDNISKKFNDRIIEYVDEHVLDVSLNGVAAHFNVSAAHLSRVFKESFGINFSDYVAEKKLQKAVELLLDESNHSIGDIAKALGYNTPAYFSRKFKERFDLTPAMYRKQYMTDTK